MAASHKATIVSLFKHTRPDTDGEQEGMELERRNGEDRRKFDDPKYNGPSRRQTLDRRK